jgi:hypothetical protein
LPIAYSQLPIAKATLYTLHRSLCEQKPEYYQQLKNSNTIA